MILLGFEVNLPIFIVSVAHGWRKGGDGARAPREVIMTGLKGVICLVVGDLRQQTPPHSLGLIEVRAAALAKSQLSSVRPCFK